MAMSSGPVHAQNAIPPPQIVPPLTRPQVQYFQQNPQEFQQLRDRLSQQAGQQPLAVSKLAPAETPSPGSWTTLTNSPGVTLQNPLLLTDGTVIASQECTGNWYRLTPDNTGSYINGTWSQIASLPSGYAPLFHGSGVLPDGRVIIAGGEYNGVSGNCGTPVDTNNAAIYDPVANVWTSVSPPSGWSHIGDAESVILDNGTYMQADCCDNIAGSYVAALLNATNLTWTATGTNKADRYDEEGFAKLHDGTVLDVDAHTSGSCGMNSEIYNPATGAWSSAGNTIHQEADCSNPGGKPSYELGPLVVRPDGSAVIFPGVTCSDVANTNCQNKAAGFVVTGTADIYTPGSGWASGPVIPTVGTSPNNYPYTLADAPAAVLPDGNVLFAASPSYQVFVAPTHFFELNFSNNTITQVGDTADAANCGSFVHNFLLLPSGQVLDVSQCGNLQIYTPLAGASQASWAPVITSVPSTLAPGASYAVSGSQLNGLTEGSYYGDDVQAATNFPLVKITNNSTGHVFYARTSNHGTMSIAPNAAGSTNFAVPANIEMGASSLVVVANGIPSQPMAVNISNSAVLTVSVTGSGTVTSNPAGINCPSTCSAGFSLGANVTLTATATSGWVFSGWSGACSGTGGCTVTMNTAQSVTATFTQLPTLTVSVTGSGTVTSSPSGISCPSTCSASFASGTQVTLTATPASGWKFSGWSGACSGTGTCSVTMNSAQSVTATFVQLTYPLAVSLTGGGSVTSNPAGISCPSTCSATFSSGAQVTLTATPAQGMSFIGWAGACSGSGGCSVTMSAAESVSAAFTTGGDPPNSRTWVSAVSGSDSNPCTRASPCLTFAAALAQTSAGGEIDVLDPGDFGPVTITKAISIYNDAVGEAGTIVAAGTSGIVVNAGANDTVSLRGLIFDGVNASGTSGIVFTSGARLRVQNCVLLGFTTSGMTFAPGTGSANTAQLVVQDTTIIGNATGILVQPTGGIGANVVLRWLRVNGNTGEGLRVDGTGGSGAINVAIADSAASFNGSNGIDAVSGPGNATVSVVRVVAAFNGSAGIQSNQSGGGAASVTVGSSMLRANAIGIQATGGSSLLTYGNNQVTANAANGSFTGTASFQ
jgi:hypothetical protein